MRPHEPFVLSVLLALLPVAPGTARAEMMSTVSQSLYKPPGVDQARPLRVEVLDGTHVRDIETAEVYRLYGIGTCAPGQRARLGRQSWPCGDVATAWLVTATLNRWLACTRLREDHGEHLVRCASSDHTDLAAAMIHDGIAVTRPATAQDPPVRAYIEAEREARKALRGLWSSSFEMPWALQAGRDADVEAADKGHGAP